VSSFIGNPAMNFLIGHVEGARGNIHFDFGDHKVPIPEKYHEKIERLIGQEAWFGVRPEHVYDTKFPRPEKPAVTITGTIEVIERLGNEILIYLSVAGQKLILKEDAHCKAEIGEKINITFNMELIHLFDKKTEENVVVK
jgi:multiple sugar transport system ATP-binding protein